MKILTSEHFREQHWKNGGGVTSELFRIPHSHEADKFSFRLSIAKVEQPGPFSLFPGVDRHLILLNGSGMRLIRSGESDVVIKTPFQLVAFPGEAYIDCEIFGPNLDFNIMVDRSFGRAEVEIANTELRPAVSGGPGAKTFIYHVNDNILVELDQETWRNDASYSALIIVRLFQFAL